MDFKKNNINTPQELMKFMQEHFSYGFCCNGKVLCENPEMTNEMNRSYKLDDTEALLKNCCGVCWDFCEFEREFFIEKKILHETFFACAFENRVKGGPTHTFLIFNQEKKWFYFEFSWGKFRGIWEYSSKEQCLMGAINRFAQDSDKHLQKYIELYAYDKPEKGLDAYEFVSHCMGGRKIDLKMREKN